jgi:hypothetical protein
MRRRTSIDGLIVSLPPNSYAPHESHSAPATGNSGRVRTLRAGGNKTRWDFLSVYVGTVNGREALCAPLAGGTTRAAHEHTRTATQSARLRLLILLLPPEIKTRDCQKVKTPGWLD